MVFVLFALIIFAFLLLGAIVFLACIPLPSMRRFALSAAFWVALWGPCTVVFFVLAGIGLVAGSVLMKAGNMQWTNTPKLLGELGWSYVVVGATIIAVVATCGAWLHQMLIHRFTFALFRIYATAISAAIGSVFGCALGWWMAAKESTYLGLWSWPLGIIVFSAGFGTAAYKAARALRGKAPTRFTWITPEEFAGSDEP
jgi:hypothetical protein